ncbi:gliding motility-associated C-terminal domain-containing protein [Labilibaculum sp. DW002]|uniref:Gliding motility-associated C-terminal domain-containing protein n=1 Tax=Paralabilibaculum antarcticum TaxID=2912572 RepID=A0ABT5VT77_9BACT|nr:gliding motility-associated C-terminal domain-containing protein [Labilibaculum sp. DW002]MDE5418625.1 gliding motility-associated C-terminal domain-containing protein [Labilibaculum sp. DW002]
MSLHKSLYQNLAIILCLLIFSLPLQVFSYFNLESSNTLLLPDNSLSVSIDTETICFGETTQIHIAPSEINVSYQLYTEGLTVGDAQDGNGSLLHFTLTPNYSATYQIIATNKLTLEKSTLNESVYLEVIRPPVDDIKVNISEDQICIGEKTIISLGNSENGVSYQLYDGTYMHGSPIEGNNAAISFPEFSPFRSVIYHIVATNKICSSTSMLKQTAKVLVGLPPEDHLHPTINNHTVCEGEEVVISLTPTDPAVSYQLFDGNKALCAPVSGNSEAINFEPTTPLTSTTYRIEALGNKCINPVDIRYTVDVDVHIHPTTNKEILANQDIICQGEEVVLSVKDSEEGMYYQLHDGVDFIEPNIIGNGSTIDFPGLSLVNSTEFHVYTHEAICSDQILLNSKKQINILDIEPFSVESFVTPSDACLGENVDIEIPMADLGIEYILLEGNQEINSITGAGKSIVFENLLPDEQSQYKILIGNCIDEFTASVPEFEVHSKPSLQLLSRDVHYGNDGQLTIHVTNGTPPYKFVIEPGQTYTTEEDVLELNNLAIGTYRILVVDDNFCRTSEAGEEIEIKFEGDKRVIVNNALTPNGDGINDEWLVQYDLELKAPEVAIFNIYGQQIFYSKAYQNNWKGSYNGSVLPSGTYYYSINFNTKNIKPIRGSLSIIGNF